MGAAKIAITLDEVLLRKVDRLVDSGAFPSRSRAVQEAVREKLERLDRSRLARECAKLDKGAERNMADEALAQDVEEWPEF